jgi:transcriptional regulator with XRE-family HTH domain
VQFKPDPIDVYVGSRVKLRRTLLGMSQAKLGDALSLTFQQIQKYERGANRIGSSRLYKISKILEVPVSFFFEDMATGAAHPAPGLSEGDEPEYQDNQLARRETLELVRAYYRITDEKIRKSMFDLVKSVGYTNPDPD